MLYTADHQASLVHTGCAIPQGTDYGQEAAIGQRRRTGGRLRHAAGGGKALMTISCKLIH